MRRLDTSRYRYQRFRQLGPKKDKEQREREADPDAVPQEHELEKSDVQIEQKAKRLAHLRQYGRTLWPFRWPVVGLFGIGVFAASLDMVFPYLFGVLVDMLPDEALDEGQKYRVLMLVGTAVLVMLLVSQAVGTFRFYATLGLNSRIIVRLRRRLHRRLMRLAMGLL